MGEKAFSAAINLFLCILRSAFDIFLLKTARIIEAVAWGGGGKGGGGIARRNLHTGQHSGSVNTRYRDIGRVCCASVLAQVALPLNLQIWPEIHENNTLLIFDSSLQSAGASPILSYSFQADLKYSF